jgi:hypothetical protein
MAPAPARTRPVTIQMTVIPLVEPVRGSTRVVLGKVVGETSAPVLRDHKTVTVAECDHAPHHEIGGSHRVSRFHRAKAVAAGVGVGRAVWRLRIVMSKVRLNRTHVHNMCKLCLCSFSGM